MRSGANTPRWRRRLNVELSVEQRLDAALSDDGLRARLQRGVLSSNHDTVVSLDWPHYCSFATEGCGGERGWCYTLSGHHVTDAHAEKVAINDLGARRCPRALAEQAELEVRALVRTGSLPYPNLRFSGSGEVQPHHIPVLHLIVDRGVRLWGFTRSAQTAVALRDIGAAAIFSCDSTTPPDRMEEAKKLGVPLAYSSRGVSDPPPNDALVTFPVHVSGRVLEAIDHASLCPKVVEEFLNGVRRSGWCQTRCKRCHQAEFAKCP